MSYKTVMGLEIHAELLTQTKIFCSCENSFGGEKNSRICPVCTGMPGSLPLVNHEAVRLGAKAGFCTDCTVHNYSAFDRKNYFYPDLPKAYQITQFYKPIATNGRIGKIRINNIHLEEDAGKLVHTDKFSEIDFNRAGVPLIEIVTEPDFETEEEVISFVTELSRRLSYCGICDCHMEQGSLRVDLNISVMREDDEMLGERAEIKNLNSFRSIRRAIAYEVKRQCEILENGGKVYAETRRFDDNSGKTFSMRSKENAQDYRYFPEPDIPTIYISDDELFEIKDALPTLPSQRVQNYIEKLGIPADDAYLIVNDKAFSDFFEAACEYSDSPKSISKLMLGELNRRLNLSGASVHNLKFSPKNLADLVSLHEKGHITAASQKEIFKIMFETGQNPLEAATSFERKTDDLQIKEYILSLLSENPKMYDDYKNGNKKIITFLMGQTMRKFGSATEPKVVNTILSQLLNDENA